MSDLGLFPLPLVLLPTEQVPLHIFEERYQELIGECVEQDSEFGLVYADDDGIRQIGTRARVADVLARFDDGRMNIVVEGRDRFRLLELTSGRSFATGEVVPLEDEDDPAELEAVDRALILFERLRDITGSEVEVPSPTTFQLSFTLAGRVELATDVKIQLLEEVSEAKRIARVCELLETAAVTVERQRQAAERAATNGRVPIE